MEVHGRSLESSVLTQLVDFFGLVAVIALGCYCLFSFFTATCLESFFPVWNDVFRCFDLFGFFSFKQIFQNFSGFFLYSPTILHAIMWNRIGLTSIITCFVIVFCSVNTAKSFFLITVFIHSDMYIVLVWGEYPLNFPPSIMIHCGARRWRSSFVFRASDFRAAFSSFENSVVLSLSVKWICDGYVILVEYLLSGDFASGIFSE